LVWLRYIFAAMLVCSLIGLILAGIGWCRCISERLNRSRTTVVITDG
jgi:hypothetical protein